MGAAGDVGAFAGAFGAGTFTAGAGVVTFAAGAFGVGTFAVGAGVVTFAAGAFGAVCADGVGFEALAPEPPPDFGAGTDGVTTLGAATDACGTDAGAGSPSAFASPAHIPAARHTLNSVAEKSLFRLPGK
jgi:hypothetical protein